MAYKGKWLPDQDSTDATQSSQEKAPIYLRLTLGGRANIATRVYATADEWDVASHRLRGKSAEAKLANATLSDWENRANEKHLALKGKPGKPLTAARLKVELVGLPAAAPLALGELITRFCESEEGGRRKLAANTLRTYRERAGHLRAYLLQIRRKNMLAAEVDLLWLRQYEHHCNDVAKLSASTTKKYLAFARMVLSFGAHEGLLDGNPATGFKAYTRNEDKAPAFLDEQELQRLATTAYRSVAVQRTADVLLFLCYTGLSHVDYCRFAPEAHLHREAGYTWLRMKRQKSGRSFSALFQPEAQALLDKYCGRLPRLNLRTLNGNLIQVRAQADIRQHITTGLARHTFSQRLRNLGFSDEGSSAQAGHEPDIMNKHYSRIGEERIKLEYERLMAAQPPTPTLAEQLRAALADPEQVASLQALMRELLPDVGRVQN